ncbi:hypothetical protein [Moorena producens]|uniref:hypothetical protein n=1 Tax=Moorena producens TaxID=1155739 RepID=UPI003C746135
MPQVRPVANLIRQRKTHHYRPAGVSPTRALHQDRCGRRFRTQTHGPLALCIKMDFWFHWVTQSDKQGVCDWANALQASIYRTL